MLQLGTLKNPFPILNTILLHFDVRLCKNCLHFFFLAFFLALSLYCVSGHLSCLGEVVFLCSLSEPQFDELLPKGHLSAIAQGLDEV